MQPKLIVAFPRYPEAQYQSLLRTILASLRSNPHFPRPWPAPVPSLEELEADFAAYLDAVQAALTGDRVKIAYRNERREALSDKFKRLAKYLELVAHGNAAMLETTGFELRRDTARRGTPGIPETPEPLRIIAALRRGRIEASVADVLGAGAYEVQISQSDPTREEGWRHVLTVLSPQRIVLDGLAAGATWLRLRGVGDDGYGPWSEPVSVVVG